jgi:hypothetical protein
LNNELIDKTEAIEVRKNEKKRKMKERDKKKRVKES